MASRKVKVDLDVDGAVKVKTLVYPDNSIGVTANDSMHQRKAPYFSCDFVATVATQPPWTGSAGASGTFTVGNVTQLENRPGIAIINSSVSVNSGYSFVTQTMFALRSGEQTSFLMAPTNNVTTDSIRAGFGDFSSAVVATANGVYFEIANGTAKGVTAKTSTRTNTATSYTFTPNIFYHFVLDMNTAGTEATFTIYTEAGLQVWQEKISANIPTSAMFHGIRASSSGTTAVALLTIDFMDITYNLPATRGKAL